MIIFKPLEKTDLPLLHSWLNQPHMRKFYQRKPITQDEVFEKYAPQIGSAVPTRSHIACYEGRPIGKIQSYRNCDYPEYKNVIRVAGGISVDLFIGEPAYLGKGLGRRMLQSYLTDVAFKIFENEKYCYICHEADNQGAIACSKAAGFKFVKNVIEDGKQSKLFKYSK